MQKPLRERTVLSSPSREQAVHRLLDAEVASLGGDPSRVAIGGNSQGGTVAIHAALTYPKPLAASRRDKPSRRHRSEGAPLSNRQR